MYYCLIYESWISYHLCIWLICLVVSYFLVWVRSLNVSLPTLLTPKESRVLQLQLKGKISAFKCIDLFSYLTSHLLFHPFTPLPTFGSYKGWSFMMFVFCWIVWTGLLWLGTNKNIFLLKLDWYLLGKTYYFQLPLWRSETQSLSHTMLSKNQTRVRHSTVKQRLKFDLDLKIKLGTDMTIKQRLKFDSDLTRIWLKFRHRISKKKLQNR